MQPDLTAGKQLAARQISVQAREMQPSTLLVLTQQYPSTWLGTNKLILFPNNPPESRQCNYYSVTSVRLLTGKPEHISRSGLQAEFHIAKLHKSMTYESVLYLVCSISKPSATPKNVLQRAVQKELQQPPFHTYAEQRF